MSADHMHAPAHVTRVAFDVVLSAGPDRVWAALVEDTTLWWPGEFHAIEGVSGMIIEARPGGRVYEHAPDGSALVWFDVVGVEPARSLDLVGHLTVPFGGPAVTFLRLTLAAEGDGTRFGVDYATVGAQGADRSAEVEAGWRAVFEDGFAGFVRGGR